MFFYTNQFRDAAAPTVSNPLKQLFGFEPNGHRPLGVLLEFYGYAHFTKTLPG
jgi:hypothetical protein